LSVYYRRLNQPLRPLDTSLKMDDECQEQKEERVEQQAQTPGWNRSQRLGVEFRASEW
jgi:hypothetical protein